MLNIYTHNKLLFAQKIHLMPQSNNVQYKYYNCCHVKFVKHHFFNRCKIVVLYCHWCFYTVHAAVHVAVHSCKCCCTQIYVLLYTLLHVDVHAAVHVVVHTCTCCCTQSHIQLYILLYRAFISSHCLLVIENLFLLLIKVIYINKPFLSLLL